MTYEDSAFKAPAARPMNRSFDWVGTKGSWFIFVIFIGMVRYVLGLVVPTPREAWTYTYYIHGAVQFYIMHWVKGTMDGSDQGRFMDQTWWEQMDGGKRNLRRTRVCVSVVDCIPFTRTAQNVYWFVCNDCPGIPWTATRKFLVCLNLALFLVLSKETEYNEYDMLINGAICLILTLAKLPEMQGVRILGINK